jgi:hypothetical protein
MVEITPMYFLKNNLKNGEQIEVKIFGIEGLAIKVPSGEARPLLVVPEDEDARMLSVRHLPLFEDWYAFAYYSIKHDFLFTKVFLGLFQQSGPHSCEVI